MRGEQSIINNLVLKHPECPIKDKIGKYEAAYIIKVIEDEYWREWKRKLEFASNSVIFCKGLGSFFIDLRQLKSNIRLLIKMLRGLKRKQEEFKLKNNRNNVVLDVHINNTTLKLRASWAQLEEQRKIIISKWIRWNTKKRKMREEHKIRYDYEQWNFSFIK